MLRFMRLVQSPHGAVMRPRTEELDVQSLSHTALNQRVFEFSPDQ